MLTLETAKRFVTERFAAKAPDAVIDIEGCGLISPWCALLNISVDRGAERYATQWRVCQDSAGVLSAEGRI